MIESKSDKTRTSFKDIVRRLYHGASLRSRIFRYSLIVFDIVTILFFIISSLFDDIILVRSIEYAVAIVIFLDFAARFWISNNRINYMSQMTTWADIIVFLTLIVPFFLENFIFLRVLRALRLLRSYHVLNDLRKQSKYFKKNEEIIQSVINLLVFIFIITALVYVLQVGRNPSINNYIDALYFTVATLTTTGFGDVTLQNTSGRLLSIIIMVVGVGLFLRLVQTIFRPSKVEYKCENCGLSRHDPDAIHCKHCGNVIKISTEGAI